jgi:AcrR family transcriptional regulator
MARLSTEARRTQLLQVGREAFALGAFDTVNLTEVASRAGVSKGLLYHYFGDKRGYYQAVLGAVALEVLEVTQFPRSMETPDAVRHAIQGFVDYVVANAPFYKALVRGGIGSDDAVNQQLETVRQGLVSRVMERLGLPDDPTTRRIVYGWIGFAEFSTLDWLEGPRTLDQVELLQRALGALLGARP